MSRILSDEERRELRDTMIEALRAERPRIVEDVTHAVKEDLRQTFELLGLAAPTEDHRADIRKDFEFLRDMREQDGAAKWKFLGKISSTFDATAQTIGRTLLWLAIIGFVSLAGWGAWVRGLSAK